MVCVLLFLPLGLYLTGAGRNRPLNVVDRAMLAPSAPLQAALRMSVDGTVSLWRHYAGLRNVQRDNDGLRVDNTRLRAQVTGYEEARGENERLKKLLSFADAHPGVKTPAHVVGVIPDPLRQWVRIDRGEQDGIARGMAVVTADGVAGQVMRTMSSASDVMLLTDANCRIGVRVQRTRSRATASGTGERTLKLDNAVRSEPLEEGDPLVTSGNDGIYPPGLLVGKVTALQRTASGMFWNAGIIPVVDVTKVEEVFVMPAPLSGIASDLTAPPPGGAHR